MRFGSCQEIRIEKSCQGMPSKSLLKLHTTITYFSLLEPRGTKSVTKTCLLKVSNSGRIPGLLCLAGHCRGGPAVSPGLALLGLPRLASASLALPAPRNNSPAAFGGRAARSAAAVVAGAGKASEADARRGEPSKPRHGEYANANYDELQPTTTNYDKLRRATTEKFTWCSIYQFSH